MASIYQKIIGFILFCVVGVAHSVPSVEGPVVHEASLSNGLKVIVIENNRAPVVVSQIWYKVGGSYEYDGITGVSHVLEHMMFKGTKRYPAGKFSEIIAANGGKENAFTSKDYTAYFQRIASDKLELCFKLESDRMRNLVFDEAEFKKELEVVKEERRLRTDDDPVALTYERFNAVAYANSPYRRPIIGWMEDLDTLTVKDAKRWYDDWYRPNNATLVVVGDVEYEEVLRLAKKYYGHYEKVAVPETKRRNEIKQYGLQKVVVEAPAKVPYLVMGYKTPVLMTGGDESELYALEVISGILDGGNSARLMKNLVRDKQIATTAGAGYSMHALHDSLFTLSAIPARGVDNEQLLSDLKSEIDKLKHEPPSRAELDRVVAQLIASSVYEKDSIFYQGMQVGMLETNGLGWRKKDEFIAGIKSVTGDQIMSAAKKYFIDENLTIAELSPKAIESKTISEGDTKK